MTPLFGVRPVVLNPADGTAMEGNDVAGWLVFSFSWSYMLRTVYGDHQRIWDTYLRPFLTGERCILDHYGPFQITGGIDDAEVEHAIVGHASASEAAVVGSPHEVKGSGLFCHVTLNFNWIEAPLPADSAHVLTASDGKITFWCPSFEQGDDQESVLGDLRLHRADNDMNTRSVGIHKMTGTDDFDTEFPRFRGGRGCQRVRFGYTGSTCPAPVVSSLAF